MAKKKENDDSKPRVSKAPKTPGTKRASVLGKALAAGIKDPNAPVTWGELSQFMDVCENNAHGTRLRAEWEEAYAKSGEDRKPSLEPSKPGASESDEAAEPQS